MRVRPAAQTLDAVRRAGVLRVGIVVIPTWAMTTRTGEFVGFDVIERAAPVLRRCRRLDQQLAPLVQVELVEVDEQSRLRLTKRGEHWHESDLTEKVGAVYARFLEERLDRQADADRFRRAAHSLKGAAAQMGAPSGLKWRCL